MALEFARVRFGETTVGAVLKDSRDAEKAICHLRALPELEDIDLCVWPSDESRGADAELLLRRICRGKNSAAS